MSRIRANVFLAASALSALSLAGCLKDGEKDAIDTGGGPSMAGPVDEPESDGEAPVLTLTADLANRWVESAGHDSIAPLVTSIHVRATQEAPEAIRADIVEGIKGEALEEAVREYGFSGAEEWAVVTARIMSGVLEALEQAHLDLAREMGIDEASPEYQKATKEVEKELAAAHEVLGDLSEPEQKVVTDRLGDIMAALKGDRVPDRGAETTE